MSNVIEDCEKELVDKELWKDSAEIVVFGSKLRLLNNFPPSEIIIEENNNDVFSNSDFKTKGAFSVTRRSQGKDIDSENKKNSYYTFYWKNKNDSQKISERIAKSYITKNIDFPETCIIGFDCYYHSDSNVNNFLLSDENHYQLLNNSFDKNSEQVSKLQQLITEYKDILSYKNSINDSVGDGYDNVFEDELLDASEDIKQGLYGVINQIEKFLVENYFLYDGSKVQDLSVIDGLRCYAWSDWEYTDATEFEFNSEIFALLQKSIVDYFDIDENMLPENLKDELNIYNLNWEGVKVERLKKQRESYDKNLSQQDFVLTN